MLGRLERDGDAAPFAELAGPHPGGIHDGFGDDRPAIRDDARDPALVRRHARDRDALEHPGATHPGALRVSHRQVGGVDAAFVCDVEGREHVIGPCRRPHPPELGGRDLLVVDAEAAHERRLAAKRLEPSR